MTASAVRGLGVVALVLAQGCIRVGRNGTTPQLLPDRVRSNGAPTRGTEGFGLKSVQGKEPPARLIARDGTSCGVSRKKFESIVLGTSVWCTWMETSR